MKLLNCPFCGTDNAEHNTYAEYTDMINGHESTSNNTGHLIICNATTSNNTGHLIICNATLGGCGATSGWAKSRKQAKKLWNRRV